MEYIIRAAKILSMFIQCRDLDNVPGNILMLGGVEIDSDFGIALEEELNSTIDFPHNFSPMEAKLRDFLIARGNSINSFEKTTYYVEECLRVYREEIIALEINKALNNLRKSSSLKNPVTTEEAVRHAAGVLFPEPTSNPLDNSSTVYRAGIIDTTEPW